MTSRPRTRAPGVAAALSLALLAAACGEGTAPSPPGPGSPSPRSGDPAATGSAPGPTGPSATGDPASSDGAFPDGRFTIGIWTSEGEPHLGYVESLARGYSADHPSVTFEVTSKNAQALAEEFLAASTTGDPPHLLWTGPAHLDAFVAAEAIRSLDGVVETSVYTPSALAGGQLDGTTWAVPISVGAHLMLYHRKSLVGEDPPADTDEMIALAKENTEPARDRFGLVFNQTESFWLVPWLGAFGGEVFAADGVTPTLATDEMRATLRFLHELKYTHQVMPSEADYNVASALFLEGRAAMIVNGDWELGNYGDALGEDLGVGPLPTVSQTGEEPRPYTVGSYWIVSSDMTRDELAVVADFVEWSTDRDRQVRLVEELRRLPANAEALAHPVITGDPLLAGSAEAVVRGTPQPTNAEIRCVFAAMTEGVQEVFAGGSDVARVSARMQSSAETCIAES